MPLVAAHIPTTLNHNPPLLVSLKINNILIHILAKRWYNTLRKKMIAGRIDQKPMTTYTKHKCEIAPGVNLTCVTTEKFKTGCISVTLVTGLSRKTASKLALTPRVLRRGSAEYPDMKRLSEALDELYGARLEPMIRKKGELHCMGFFADFPDDRYIDDKNILEKTARLLGGVLLKPDMPEGLLRSDYVNGERSYLIDDIRAMINDKRGYSIKRLLEEMCSTEEYSVGKLGSEDDAKEITPETLTAQYQDVLAKSRIEVFYCGSAPPGRVKSALDPMFSDLPSRQSAAPPETKIILYPDSGAPKHIIEKLDVVQGKMAIGYRLGDAMKGTPDYPALMVANAVYGSGDTSKLFRNVREKMSLSYSVGSMLDMHKGIMVVTAGVDFNKVETALNEIQAQLGQVGKGEVSEQEMTSAKSSVATAVKLALDRPGGLEGLYFDSAVSPVPYDPDELGCKIEAVTRDDVAKIASEAHLDTIYFLTGTEEGVEHAT